MPLLQSAIDAIEMGVEDHASGDVRRTASAVRNLYAGVLLLLKEKLRRESPPDSEEALLYERFGAARNAMGAVVLVGRGTKTVDRDAIVRRFVDLGLKLDRKRLDRLATIRNEIEHHVTKHAPSDVQAAIEATFVVVASVLDDLLGLKPSSVFSEKTWARMLAEAETYKDISDRCQKSIRALVDAPDEVVGALQMLQCPECGSELMQALGQKYYEAEFACAVCDVRSELHEVIGPALSSAYAGEAYESVKEGGEPPIGVCPTCNVKAFSLAADECLACGEGRPYRNCTRCENDLGLDEQDDEGVCSYCRHVMEKND